MQLPEIAGEGGWKQVVSSSLLLLSFLSFFIYFLKTSSPLPRDLPVTIPLGNRNQCAPGPEETRLYLPPASHLDSIPDSEIESLVRNGYQSHGVG